MMVRTIKIDGSKYNESYHSNGEIEPCYNAVADERDPSDIWGQRPTMHMDGDGSEATETDRSIYI